MAGGRLWTRQEDEVLINEYRGHNAEAVAVKIGRTVPSVQVRAMVLRRRGEEIQVRMRGASIAWSKEDVELLEDLWGTVPLKEVARKLDLTPGAVLYKAHHTFGTLRENREYMSPRDVGEIMGVSDRTIRDWMSDGYIKDRRKSTKTHYTKEDQYGKPRCIVQRTLENFIRQYPYVYDRTKITHDYYRALADRVYAEKGEWLHIQSASELSGIARNSLWWAVKKGRITHVLNKSKRRKRVFFTRAALIDFVRGTQWPLLKGLKPEFREECGLL